MVDVSRQGKLEELQLTGSTPFVEALWVTQTGSTVGAVGEHHLFGSKHFVQNGALVAMTVRSIHFEHVFYVDPLAQHIANQALGQAQ